MENEPIDSFQHQGDGEFVSLLRLSFRVAHLNLKLELYAMK